MGLRKLPASGKSWIQCYRVFFWLIPIAPSARSSVMFPDVEFRWENFRVSSFWNLFLLSILVWRRLQAWAQWIIDSVLFVMVNDYMCVILLRDCQNNDNDSMCFWSERPVPNLVKWLVRLGLFTNGWILCHNYNVKPTKPYNYGLDFLWIAAGSIYVTMRKSWVGFSRTFWVAVMATGFLHVI